jgi:hypothetical protein
MMGKQVVLGKALDTQFLPLEGYSGMKELIVWDWGIPNYFESLLLYLRFWRLKYR